MRTCVPHAFIGDSRIWPQWQMSWEVDFTGAIKSVNVSSPGEPTSTVLSMSLSAYWCQRERSTFPNGTNKSNHLTCQVLMYRNEA